MFTYFCKYLPQAEFEPDTFKTILKILLKIFEVFLKHSFQKIFEYSKSSSQPHSSRFGGRVNDAKLIVVRYIFSATQTPFQLNFLTDQWTTSTQTGVAGFKLTYFEVNC